MAETSYRDLAEFGLPLVTPDHPAFAGLVREIESLPDPLGPRPVGDLDPAAVLLNQSGKAIVGISYFWRCATADGVTRRSRVADLISSLQLRVLTGRAKVVADLCSFILPRSKRLITEQGMFGNNLDVLPQVAGRRYGGCTSYSGGGGFRNGTDEPITAIELCLDLAIFEDGLCAGPDEAELFTRLTESLQRQCCVARQVADALRDGAPAGLVFEILRPLARGNPTAGPGAPRFADVFANVAIQELIDRSGPELLAWFEKYAQPPSLRLHRP